MGDSITALWPLPKTNLGIGGQVTAEMLSRFGDIYNYSPYAVAILGGTNDARLDVDTTDTIGNLKAMVDDANKHGVKVFLGSIPPSFTTESAWASTETNILLYNPEIYALCATGAATLVDYATVMAGHPEYFKDGIHPNEFGYAVMEQELRSTLDLSL